LVGKSERKKENNWKKWDWREWTVFIWLRYERAVSSEHGNELSGPIECREFLY
jgi:hypothetical protein